MNGSQRVVPWAVGSPKRMGRDCSLLVPQVGFLV